MSNVGSVFCRRCDWHERGVHRSGLGAMPVTDLPSSLLAGVVNKVLAVDCFEGHYLSLLDFGVVGPQAGFRARRPEAGEA